MYSNVPKHPFPRQPIQSPHQHNIKAPLRGILKHPPECIPISGLAGYMILVDIDHFPLVTCRVLLELVELCSVSCLRSVGDTRT